jgi:hypothetical protein
MSPPENHEAAKSGGAQAPESDANAQPAPDAKAPPAPDAKAQPETTPKAVPAPSTTAAAKPDAQGASVAQIGTLLKTMVGDLARAGMLKDPELAGHIVADTIIAAETPVQPAKSPKEDGPDQAPPAVAPKAAA